MPFARLAGVLALAVLAILACRAERGSFEVELLPLPADAEEYAPLAGYGEMTIPADNPLTAEKAALGRQLYHDARLSGDGQRSCYGCHVCEHGLTDGRTTALGAFDKVLSRNSPTMWNVGFHSLWYWDGRATTLEGQAAAAWKGGNMGAKDTAPVLETINDLDGYRTQFEAVFGGPATEENVPQALAAYMRTIVGGNTPWDRGEAGDAAQRGHAVFERLGCTECLAGVLFTDLVFHNVGIGYDPATGEYADVGRYEVTENPRDRGAFKTPTLRDVAQSGPYFHDGSVETLEEAVAIMVAGGQPNPHLDPLLAPKDVTDAEMSDLLAFLRALDEPCEMPAPRLP